MSSMSQSSDRCLLFSVSALTAVGQANPPLSIHEVPSRMVVQGPCCLANLHRKREKHHTAGT